MFPRILNAASPRSPDTSVALLFPQSQPCSFPSIPGRTRPEAPGRATTIICELHQRHHPCRERADRAACPSKPLPPSTPTRSNLLLLLPSKLPATLAAAPRAALQPPPSKPTAASLGVARCSIAQQRHADPCPGHIPAETLRTLAQQVPSF